MGAIYDFEKEKLIVGVIYSNKEILDAAMSILKEKFGEKAEPLYPRLAKYFQILESYGFVTLK